MYQSLSNFVLNIQRGLRVFPEVEPALASLEICSNGLLLLRLLSFVLLPPILHKRTDILINWHPKTNVQSPVGIVTVQLHVLLGAVVDNYVAQIGFELVLVESIQLEKLADPFFVLFSDPVNHFVHYPL